MVSLSTIIAQTSDLALLPAVSFLLCSSIEQDLQQIEAQFHCFRIQLNDLRRKLSHMPQYCGNFISELEMLHLSVERSWEALSTIEKLLQFLVDHSCNPVVQALCSFVQSTKLIHMTPENVGVLRELAAYTINLITVGQQIKLDELELLEMWNSHTQRKPSGYFGESPADTRFSQESGLGICSSGFSSLPSSTKNGDASEFWVGVYPHRRSASAPTLTPDEIVAQSPLMYQPLCTPVLPHADACSFDSFFMDATLLDLDNESSGFGCDVSLFSDDKVSRLNVPSSFHPFVNSSEVDLSNTFAPPKHFYQPPCSTSSYGYKSAHRRALNYTASLNRLNSVSAKLPPSADPNNYICTTFGSTGHLANAVLETLDLCELPYSTNQLAGFDTSTVLSTPFTRLPVFCTVDESKNLGDTMPAAEPPTGIHHIPHHLSPSRDVVRTSTLQSNLTSKWKRLVHDPKNVNRGPKEETTLSQCDHSASVSHSGNLAAYSYVGNTDECRRVSRNALPTDIRSPWTISQTNVSSLTVTTVSLVTLMLLSLVFIVHIPRITRQTVSEVITHTPEDNYPFSLISPELGVGLIPFGWLRQILCLQPPDAKYVPY
ncbi:unnamed protein product [Dicrocoelium dendriticum]|nr:unnamed protein product [Dicrocoelium dendriticum]